MRTRDVRRRAGGRRSRRRAGGLYTGSVPRRRSGATTYAMQNWRGDAARQTNATGGTTAYRAYDAFGVRTINNLTPVGPFGYAAEHGYQGDEDSGLMLLGHRYYDPSTGRFLTRDPIKDGRNWYAYCENNPLRSVDPTGLYSFIGLKFSLAYIISIDVNIGINIGDDGSKSPHFDAGIGFGPQLGLSASPTLQLTPDTPVPKDGWHKTGPAESSGMSLGPLDLSFPKDGGSPTYGFTPVQAGIGTSTSLIGVGYDGGPAGGGHEHEGPTSTDPSILIPTDGKMREYLRPRYML